MEGDVQCVGAIDFVFVTLKILSLFGCGVPWHFVFCFVVLCYS